MKPTVSVLGTLFTGALLVALTALPAAAGDGSSTGNPLPDVSEILAHPDVLATASVADCVPNMVASFATRVHVRCTASVTVGSDTVWYWAVSTSDQSEAARALSILLTAKALAKHVYIYYTGTDLSGAAIGCANSDCRLAWGVELRP